MITFSHNDFRLSFTFGFFFILAITTLQDNRIGTLSLCFCIAHELGHLSAMYLLGARASGIKFYGAGISISSDCVTSLPKGRQALIYLAGPAVNLLLAMIFRGEIRALNLCLAVFNLLPIAYFDGGKLAGLILSEKGRASKALSALAYTFLAALIICAVVMRRDSVSPSSLLSLCFIALSLVLDE